VKHWFLIALVACKAKHAAHDDAPLARDAAPPADAANAWPELADYPQIDALRTVALPVDKSKPRGDTGGPAVAFGVAVVSSSQFGFVAIDVATGQVVWKKPAGERVAPPLAVADGFVLISDCTRTEDAPKNERVLGCMRTVSPTGADRGYVVIHGRDLAIDPGPQATWLDENHTVVWRRGSHAVGVDLFSGQAWTHGTDEPPLVVHYKKRTWEISRRDDGVIRGREKGTDAWHTERHYGALLGAVYLPEQSPMVRVSNAGHYGGAPELIVFDIDATGSLHGQVARPVPGVALSAHAIDSVGNTVLAIQLDASLSRDYVAGYAANGLVMWVWPLPRRPRVDPIGVAIAPEVVVVFHDGDTVSILPELSAPPTAPGAARPALENTTP
jgi:hypothetical protein